MWKANDLIGSDFGILKVVSRSMPNNNFNKAMWQCECQCGQMKVFRGDSLKAGKIKSCGCDRIPHNREPDRVKAIWKQLYLSTIVKRSKKWQKTTDLTLNDFIEISKKSCFYCGHVGSNYQNDRKVYKIKNKEYVYDSSTSISFNGLDRINSQLGYEKSNVVACCKHCNIAKNILTTEEFREWIKQVYHHFAIKT